MANRVAATYAQATARTTHTISFTAPAAGSRLILLISSYNTVSSVMTGAQAWTQDVGFIPWNSLYVYSRIATGTETTVTITVASSDARVHAVLHERDDCPTKLFQQTIAVPVAATTISATATVPAGAAGRVFTVLNTSDGSNPTGVTYNQGLVSSFTAAGTGSGSAFATGAMPAAGSRTWTANNITASEENGGWVVIGYGVTDAQAPTTPANLRTTAVAGTSVGVAWDASSDNVGVTGYGVYLGGVKQGADQAGLTATLSGLIAGQTYTVQVDAVDAAGNRSAKASLQVTTDGTPPSVPGNLRVTAVSNTQVSVAWDASSDNIGVAGYGVYLDGAKQGGDQAGLGRTFTGLTPGQSYLVQVDAVDAAGNRSGKASVTATPEVDTQPPSAPPNLHLTAGGPYGFTSVDAGAAGALRVGGQAGAVLHTVLALGVVLVDGLDGGAVADGLGVSHGSPSGGRGWGRFPIRRGRGGCGRAGCRAATRQGRRPWRRARGPWRGRRTRTRWRCAAGGCGAVRARPSRRSRRRCDASTAGRLGSDQPTCRR
ncbi:fibronectin type III domain-containing protein (plasmid) [Actinomadura sp. ATCC 31491]|uniref:Fibronectin type III domain-containing protein n=1 Tax=Actinomadura luzonensis TaxID=2805427 RepID=A0ABT0GD91_9ACTN|nr:fibronectin type III domain-containing protein [Actinomadura luzonensis]MCK2222073.1 fibronectin type III domain-containing protein [Actinomadura luzonensis]